jgi:hypothetical protein
MTLIPNNSLIWSKAAQVAYHLPRSRVLLHLVYHVIMSFDPVSDQLQVLARIIVDIEQMPR